MIIRIYMLKNNTVPVINFI